MKVSKVLLLAALVTLPGCGATSNFNQIWGGNDDGGDTLLAGARAAYDSGDFDKAAEMAEKAAANNPDNEEAAVLLGYVYLSRGGIDPYRLARELIGLSASDKKDEATSLTQDDDSDSKANDAASTLTELSGLINLSEEDFQTLGETYSSDKSDLFDPAANGVSLISPALVNDELRNQVEVLKNMNLAIKSVCRFVNNSTKSEIDPRHGKSDCDQVDQERKFSSKAHFLWAFTHLTESLVFQSVLLYTGGNTAVSGQSNFQTASQNLDKFDGDFDGFVNAVDDMKSAVDTVFQTDSDDPDSMTMITATLENLSTVDRAFAALTGLPSGISKRLTQALEKINSIGEQVGGESGNAKALKGQMTEKFAGVVSEKVDTAVDAKLQEIAPGVQIPPTTKVSELGNFGVPDDQVQEIQKVCTSFDGLVEGIPEEKVKKPAKC